MDHKSYFSNLLDALNFERAEELRQNEAYLQSKSIQERVEDGFSWYPLIIVETGYGLGDTPYIELERTKHLAVKHQFSAGSMIQIFSNQQNNLGAICKGQIQFVQNNRMKIFLHQDDHPDWLDLGKIGIDLLVDESSYLEMTKTLQFLQKSINEDLPKAYAFLSGQYQNTYEENTIEASTILNPAQNLAVHDIVNASDLSLIYGPPGTGKSTTLIQAVSQIKRLKITTTPILVCAPSNTAVDHLVRKLHEQDLNVLRVGNISRIDDSVYALTLEEKVKQHDDYKYIKKIKRNADELRKMALQYKRSFGYSERQQRKSVLQQAKEMMKDANLMEDSIIDDVLIKSDVICTTLVGSNHRYLRQRKFHICIIDEAGQAIEPACWIPIQKTQKIILAGDPQQLPPTIKSAEAKKLGLDHTLFEKLIEQTGIASFLDIQYRMNEEIMDFSNDYFYEGNLIADDSVKYHSIDAQAIEFIDTAGCAFDEKQKSESRSLFNPEEIKIIQKHLSTLPLDHHSIGIISPYRAQVNQLQSTNFEIEENSSIRIETIDSFQGQEADIIYISLVRSNDRGEIGFLKDYRRMNVAMTRARKKLVIVGDSTTIGNDPFYHQLLEYFEMQDAYKSAWEYMEY